MRIKEIFFRIYGKRRIKRLMKRLNKVKRFCGRKNKIAHVRWSNNDITEEDVHDAMKLANSQDVKNVMLLSVPVCLLAQHGAHATSHYPAGSVLKDQKVLH